MRIYQVDLGEAVRKFPREYVNFNDFFTRRLEATARPLAADPNSLVSPADGTLYQFGKIEPQIFYSAKGFDFSLEALLGHQAQYAAAFADGDFFCMYLSPRDYHRVHMPYTGTLLETLYIPGKLFSVAPASARHIPDIFARNERLICLFETDRGPLIIILVGAMIVGSIHTVWAGAVNPRRERQAIRTHYRQENISLEKGAELGHFQLGSTVIVLLPPKRINWHASVRTDKHLKFGEPIGKI